MPETCDNVWEPVGSLDDGQYIVRVFYAEHTIWTDETGRITEEEKKFIDTDSEDCLTISLHDENLEYCKYKTMELERLPE